MGGCRCIFRDCTVATSRHPRMHFFRFPIKDKDRMLKWVKMAKVPNLLQLPLSVQKNKCVCARHFRDECFMNYMKDKLVANAVPTLERIKGGYALDYENDETKIVQLNGPVLRHMIPPPCFECPLHLEELENDLEETNINKIQARSSSSINKRMASIAESSTIASKKVKILNSEAPEKEVETTDSSTSDGYISKFVEFVDISDEQNQEKYLVNMDDCIVMDDDSYPESTTVHIIDTNSMETPESDATSMKEKYLTVAEISKRSGETKAKRLPNQRLSQDSDFRLDKERSKFATYEEELSKQQMQLVEALQTASLDLEIKTNQYDTDTQELKSKIEQLTAKNNNLESECEHLGISNSLLKDRLKTFEEKLASLQEQNEQLDAQNLALQQMQQQQQVSTVSTSKESLSNMALTVAPASTLPAHSALSKAQLFNGIKKYLSSSMVALVRMEMFGSAERQWKPDEKQASLDLLTLGETVYKYFTDEWRFRLPGLRQVLAWQNEAAIEPDEEEDL